MRYSPAILEASSPDLLPSLRYRDSKLRSRAHFRTTWVWPSVVTILLFCLFAAIGLTPAQYIPLSLLLGITGQRVVLLAMRTDQDMFEPINFLAGYFIVFFALRAVYLLTYPTAKQIGVFYYADYLPQALWCALLGYVFCVLGLRSGVAPWIARKLRTVGAHIPQWPQYAPNMRIALMLAIGIGCWIYLFSQGGFVVGNVKENVRINSVDPISGIPTLLAALLDMGSTAGIICLLICARTQSRVITWILVIAAASFIMFRMAYSGSKQSMLEPLGQAVLVYHYLRKRLTLGRFVLVGLPTILIAFGIMNIYRFVAIQQSGGAPKSVSELMQKVEYAYQYFTSDHQEQVGTTAFEMLMEREFGVDSLAVIIKFTPERRPWGLGEDYIDIPGQLLIPRALWPDKPVHYATGAFERDYLGPGWQGGFTSIHLISDFYQNFHVFGIAVGMFLVGALLQALFLICQPTVRGAAGVLAYSVIILGVVHSLEWDLTSIIAYYTRYLALTAFVVWFLCARLGGRTQSLRRSYAG